MCVRVPPSPERFHARASFKCTCRVSSTAECFFWMGAAKRRERRQKEFIITPLGPPHYCIAFLDSGSVGLLTACVCVCVYCIPPFPQLDDCPGMLTEESAGGVCRCERACVCLCAGTEGDSAGGE